jgi:hypothetical protein
MSTVFPRPGPSRRSLQSPALSPAANRALRPAISGFACARATAATQCFARMGRRSRTKETEQAMRTGSWPLQLNSLKGSESATEPVGGSASQQISVHWASPAFFIPRSLIPCLSDPCPLSTVHCNIGTPAMRCCHSAGPVWCTLVPLESTATVTGMSFTSNS